MGGEAEVEEQSCEGRVPGSPGGDGRGWGVAPSRPRRCSGIQVVFLVGAGFPLQVGRQRCMRKGRRQAPLLPAEVRPRRQGDRGWGKEHLENGRHGGSAK